MNEMKKCHLVVGRFQGVTKKHEELIQRAKNRAEEDMVNVVVGIVCGAKSSQDMKRNPFNFTECVQMLRILYPQYPIKYVKLPTAFIGDAVEVLWGFGYNITGIFIGADRAESFQKQLSNHKYYKEHFPFVDVEFDLIPLYILPRDNDISASQIREALYTGDRKTFWSLSPQPLHAHEKWLKEIVLQRMGDPFPVKT